MYMHQFTGCLNSSAQNTVPLSLSNGKGQQMTFAIIVCERQYYKLNEITSVIL